MDALTLWLNKYKDQCKHVVDCMKTHIRLLLKALQPQVLAPEADIFKGPIKWHLNILNVMHFLLKQMLECDMKQYGIIQKNKPKANYFLK